jgi:hypothetical protein
MSGGGICGQVCPWRRPAAIAMHLSPPALACSALPSMLLHYAVSQLLRATAGEAQHAQQQVSSTVLVLTQRSFMDQHQPVLAEGLSETHTLMHCIKLKWVATSTPDTDRAAFKLCSPWPQVPDQPAADQAVLCLHPHGPGAALGTAGLRPVQIPKVGLATIGNPRSTPLYCAPWLEPPTYPHTQRAQGGRGTPWPARRKQERTGAERCNSRHSEGQCFW